MAWGDGEAVSVDGAMAEIPDAMAAHVSVENQFPDSPEESGNLLYESESTQTRTLRNLCRIYLALHHPTLPSDNSATRAPECVQNPRC